MEMTRRDLLKGGAALGVAATVPLTADGPAQAQTTQKKELVVAQGGDISKFDPHFSTSSNDIRVSFNLFDNLVSRHPDGKLHPGLATEWKNQAPTTWTFKLRRGVKWHNGDPFSSADAKYSLERTLDPQVKTRVSTVFTTIDRIEAPDATTLVIHTKKPDPLLAARLAFYGGQIVPKKYLEAVGGDTFNAKPIGTGPVRFVSWTKDDKVVLEANPDYWGGRIGADRVIVRAIPEMAPRVAALLKGEVDVITQLPPDQGDRVNANASTRVAGALYAGLYVLAVNSKMPPLDNPLVKQALSLAIDRPAIVKELWKGRGIVPSGPIAKGDNHFDASLPPLAYNPKEARERLKKAGYKNEEVVIETTSGYTANDKPMSEAIAAMWKDVGINAKVEVVEYSVRAQKNRDKSFKGLWWSDPTSTLGDPDGMMWRLLAPGGPQDYWRNAKFDELGEAARFSIDEKFRGQAYKDMTKVFLEHLPWLPVIQPYEDYGLQK
ncbi:MAG: ABC transporter substrate-binding protein, partial [Candidatus Rokuibacteriota bacterium]